MNEEEEAGVWASWAAMLYVILSLWLVVQYLAILGD